MAKQAADGANYRIRSAGWALLLLLLATGMAEAQEARTAGKKPRPVASRKAADARKAEARAAAEQAARQRAEEESRLKAEEESRRRAAELAKQLAEERRQAEIEAREQPLRDADGLIKAGKPDEAYALLEPLEYERSGEVRFDYLIGIAALDSGKPDKATLAFERVLAVDPNFAGARLDLARAYFQLGDMARAKAEFEAVMKANPPEAARATIEKYLAAIEVQDKAKTTRVTGYIEGTAGYDTNVNNSTSQGQIAVPALGNMVFTLSPNNQKMADSYAGLNAGVNVTHPVSETTSLYAGVDLRGRNNMKQTAFNSLSLDARAGGIFALGAQDGLRVGLTGGQYALNNMHNRDAVGVSGEWSHVFSPANQMSLFFQETAYRFVDPAMKTEDFDQGVLGLGWRHVLPDGRSALFSSLFYGEERDVAPVTVTNPVGGRPDGRKRLTGLRVGGQAAMSDDVELFMSAGAIDGTYSRQNVLFQVNRHDVMTDAIIGANWHWTKLWILRPQLAWSHNQSNISLYTYDRIDASLTLRREFE